jgi:hypothetical protein
MYEADKCNLTRAMDVVAMKSGQNNSVGRDIRDRAAKPLTIVIASYDCLQQTRQNTSGWKKLTRKTSLLVVDEVHKTRNYGNAYHMVGYRNWGNLRITSQTCSERAISLLLLLRATRTNRSFLAEPSRF